MLTAWGPDLCAFQREFRGEASHPSRLESQQLRDQQASRCRKSRKWEPRMPSLSRCKPLSHSSPGPLCARDQQTSRCRKSRKWEPRMPRSSRCKPLSGSSPGPLCAKGIMLSWLLRPASCIPNPATSPPSWRLFSGRFLPIPRVLFPSALRPFPILTVRSRCSLCL